MPRLDAFRAFGRSHEATCAPSEIASACQSAVVLAQSKTTEVDFTEASWNRTQIAEVDATSARIVPEDLDLSAMVGTRLDSVTFAEYMLVLSYDSGHAFSIHGRVELRDQGGTEIESGSPDALRLGTQLPALVGEEVDRVLILAPQSIQLHMSSGRVIALFDDSKQYESFQIEPGGIIV